MPSTPTDRIDGLSTSVAVKAPCTAVELSNITLAGLQGYTEGDRVLCVGQTNGVENGIYNASSGSWTRAKDFDGNRDVVKGTLIPKAAGTAIFYRLTTADPVVIGTSSLTFEAVSETLDQSALGELLYPRTAAEIAAEVDPVNYFRKPGNIRRYFNAGVVDGTTDVAYAIRKALDLAAYDGTTVHCDPPGLIKVGSVVYLPQRSHTALGSNTRYGYLMDFYGSTFIGQGRGTGTIFESGTGSVSTGGATNFGQADESSASLHYGTIIKGGRFRSCDLALNLFNFVKGCKLEDLYVEDVDGVIVTDRCFYLELHNVHAQVDDLTANDVLFDFGDVNNAITIIGCEAGGTGTLGTGFRFTGGGSGIIFHGNTAELLARGLTIASAIEGIDIRGNFFEACDVAGIDASASGNKHMDVDNNWFYLNGKALDAAEWVAGRFGASNYFAGTPDEVDISDVDSKCIVEIPAQIFTEAQSASAVKVPPNYTLGPTVTLVAPREVYVAATGLAAPLAIDASHGGPDVPAFVYSGGTSQVGANFTVPFCAQTLNVGSSVIDTQINYNDYHMHVYFGLYTEINGAKVIAGTIGPGTNVWRKDALTNISVTASDNSGKLRLTIAGSDHSTYTSSGFWGQIRHI